MRNSRALDKVTEIAKSYPATCRIPEVGVAIVKSFDNIRDTMTDISSKVSSILTEHSNELELYYQAKRGEAEAQLRKLNLQVLESEGRAAADTTVKSLSTEVEWYKQEVARIEGELLSYKDDILEYKDCLYSWQRDHPLLEEKILNLKWQIRSKQPEQADADEVLQPVRQSPCIPAHHPPDTKKRIQYVLELNDIEARIRETRAAISEGQTNACNSGLAQAVIVKDMLHQALRRIPTKGQREIVGGWMASW